MIFENCPCVSDSLVNPHNVIAPVCDPREQSNVPDAGASFVAKSRLLCKQHCPKECEAGFQLRPVRWFPQMV